MLEHVRPILPQGKWHAELGSAIGHPYAEAICICAGLVQDFVIIILFGTSVLTQALVRHQDQCQSQVAWAFSSIILLCLTNRNTTTRTNII